METQNKSEIATENNCVLNEEIRKAESFNPNKAVIKYLTEEVVDRSKAYGTLLKMCAELVLLRSLLLTSFLLWIWVIATQRFPEWPGRDSIREQLPVIFWSLKVTIAFLTPCIMYATCNTQERFRIIQEIDVKLPSNCKVQ